MEIAVAVFDERGHDGTSMSGPGMPLCLSESSLHHRMPGKAELREGTLPAPPAMDTLAIEPIEVEPGRIAFEMTPERWHYNALGGVLAALADNALGAPV